MSNNFGKYQILSVLGQGAMGKVYLAQDPEGKQIALKVILPEALERSGNADDTIDRFKRESKLALELVHPHIVRTYDAGEVDGKLYLTCELMSGGGLDEILKQKKILSEKQALLILRDVALGLNEIHQKGFVHRDIKPANVLMDQDGKAKLSDLGLLRSTSQDRTILTQPGSLIGTPHYISPEQIEGEGEIDIRSDIYAVGAVFFMCLSGHTPYTGSVLAVLQSHLIDPIPQVVEQKIRPQVQQLINDLMAKNPQDRVTNPRELLEVVDILLPGALTSSEGTSSENVSIDEQKKINESEMTVVPGNIDLAAKTVDTPPAHMPDSASATVSYSYPSPHKPYEKTSVTAKVDDAPESSVAYAHPTAMPVPSPQRITPQSKAPQTTVPQETITHSNSASVDQTVVRQGIPDAAAETFIDPSISIAKASSSNDNAVESTMVRQGVPDAAEETFVDGSIPVPTKDIKTEKYVNPNSSANVKTDKYLDPNSSQAPAPNQINIAPAANQAQVSGLNRAKLVVSSAAGVHTLFVYGGHAIQGGRNGINYAGQDVCLRLRPSAGNEKSIKRISGTHFRTFVDKGKTFFCDVGSSKGSTFDGQKVAANTPIEVTSSHAVKIAGVIDISLNFVATTQAMQYNIEGVGAIEQAPAVFIMRPFNGAEHAYTLVPGSIKLGVQQGALRVNVIGSITIFYVAGSLWLCGGSLAADTCIKLYEGLTFKADDYNVAVNPILPQDQK